MEGKLSVQLQKNPHGCSKNSIKTGATRIFFRQAQKLYDTILLVIYPLCSPDLLEKNLPHFWTMCLSRLAGLHGQSHSCHSVPHIHINPLPGCVWKWKKKAPELQSEHGNMSYMRGLRCFFSQGETTQVQLTEVSQNRGYKKSNLYHISYRIGYKLDN